MGPISNKAINLASYKLNPVALSMLPPMFMKKYSCIPFDYIDGKLLVAMPAQASPGSIDQLLVITGKELEIFYAPIEQIWMKLNEILPALAKEREARSEANPGGTTLADRMKDSDSIETVNKILKSAIQKRASDIHIEPQESALFIRYRVDGILTTVKTYEKALESTLISCVKVMANMDISEKRLPQDNQFSSNIMGHKVDFRVSTLPGKFGEKVVIRILDKSRLTLDLSQIGMDSIVQSSVEELIQKPQGLLLVTGPTGSGKTTTLYSMLNRLISPEKNIITLEDPTEYDLLSGKPTEAGIIQVSMNMKIGMNFAAGLRAALRQDPDIIMVGEIRDRETAEIAMKSSLTGHLVLSTLHTNDSFSTILRLKDMGVEPYLVASTIIGIIAQRLVRTLCPLCKEPYTPPQRALEKFFNISSPTEKPITLYRAKGCPQCLATGYVGRKGIYELLIMNNQLMELIQGQSNPDPANEIVRGAILTPLRESGLNLAEKGITTIEEVLRITV